MNYHKNSNIVLFLLFGITSTCVFAGDFNLNLSDQLSKEFSWIIKEMEHDSLDVLASDVSKFDQIYETFKNINFDTYSLKKDVFKNILKKMHLLRNNIADVNINAFFALNKKFNLSFLSEQDEINHILYIKYRAVTAVQESNDIIKELDCAYNSLHKECANNANAQIEHDLNTAATQELNNDLVTKLKHLGFDEKLQQGLSWVVDDFVAEGVKELKKDIKEFRQIYKLLGDLTVDVYSEKKAEIKKILDKMFLLRNKITDSKIELFQMLNKDLGKKFATEQDEIDDILTFKIKTIPDKAFFMKSWIEGLDCLVKKP